MKLGLILCALALVFINLSSGNNNNYQDLSDNEFAEFEDFEADEDTPNEPIAAAKPGGGPSEATAGGGSDFADEDVAIDDEIEVDDDDDSEFEHFHDGDEFEGFELPAAAEKGADAADGEPKITITKVPIHFRANWDSYYLEMLMLAGLAVYFINFARGRSKNTRIASAWLSTHRQLLEDNFALVGDDGGAAAVVGGASGDNGGEGRAPQLTKESENVYTLWCSGRTCCEGMLVELKLIKRQDLLAILSGMMRPTLDQIHIQIRMNKDEMDTFVFCVAAKKTAQHLVKEMADLSVYCPERRPGDKYNLPSQFHVMSEIPEATSAMLDAKVTAILNKYADLIDYIHFSDQYTGAKQAEEDQRNLKLPDTEKVLLFGLNLPLKGVSLEEAVSNLKPIMSMIFYCMEKARRYRLSKEGKSKADRNRQRVEEAFLKSTHQARAEAAAARREEKRRQEKERVMADDDPERQRRWEIKEEKRQAKKRAPKMKQLKVKAL